MPPLSVTIYSVTGPSRASDYFWFDVPGGVDFLQSAADLMAKRNPNAKIRLCVGHLSEWGPLELASNSRNLQFCVHETSLASLDLRLANHPSAQHGAILDWMLYEHPPESDKFIVMDPDFFLLGNEALGRVLNGLQGSVVTSGVPYPARGTKNVYWDFPVVFFQALKSGQRWVFSPETSLDQLPGEKTTFASRTFVKIGRSLGRVISLVEGRRSSMSAWQVWLAQLIRIPLEIMGGDPNKLQDTGFKNRQLHGADNFIIFDHVVRVSHAKFGLKSEAWEQANTELSEVSVPPGWYALRHGTLEKRDFAGQRGLMKLFAGIPLRGSRRGPAAPVFDCERLGLSDEQMEIFLRLNHLGVDFYSMGGVLLGAHLGSEVKSRLITPNYNLGTLSKDLAHLGGMKL